MKARFLLPVLGLILAGCGNGGGDTSAGTTTGGKAATTGDAKSGGGEFKVALLTVGPVSDAGWNALAYNGLQTLKDKIPATVNNRESSGTSIKDDLRTYAQQGYNLVIGHGFEYNDPAVAVAKDFPNTVFITSSGGKTAANVGAFRFYLEQGFYLAGILAAKMSRTGVLGEVAVQNIPPIESTLQAFEAGAKSVNPAIKFAKVEFGNGDDLAAAKQAAEEVVAKKADFIIHQADNAAQSVFDVAKEHGIYAIGANSDQNDNQSGVVIASAVIDMNPPLLKIAQDVKNKTFKGQVFLVGMDTDSIHFVINPKLKDKVPADVQKLIEDTAAQIKSGKITVPKIEF